MTSILENELVPFNEKDRMAGRMTIEQRFWDKVKKTEGCWLWIGGSSHVGYGRFGIGLASVNSHRASWIINRGPIPKGKWVLHTCDNQKCVRPDHLYLGGIKENTADAVSRKRLHPPKWENHRDAKLNWIAVRAIRELHKSGQWSYARLARKFGVSKSCIDGVISGRHWKGDPNAL